MTAAAALPELLRLPAREKTTIIEALCDSLDEEEGFVMDDELKRVLAARMADDLAHPEKGVPMEEFFKQAPTRIG